MLTQLEMDEFKGFLKEKQYQEYHPETIDKIKKFGWYTLIEDHLSKTCDSKRADYILENLNYNNLKVLDIGANLGYFSLSAALNGATEVLSVESDKVAIEFIKLQLKLLGMEKVVKTQDFPFDFGVKQNKTYDVILCLNVLHHIGRYFGDKDLNLEEAKTKLIEYLNLLSCSTKYCWFQIGFNWKGNIEFPLFDNGLKSELIEFVVSNISDYWEVKKIAIFNDETMRYSSNNYKMDRIEELGEFGNRPLFLLESKIKL